MKKIIVNNRVYVFSIIVLVIMELSVWYYFDKKESKDDAFLFIPTPVPKETFIISNVIKIISHSDDYSVLYRKNIDSKEIIENKLWEWTPFIKSRRMVTSDVKTNFHIIEDSKPGNMYVEIKYWNQYWFEIFIHVDDARTAFIGG